MIYSHYQFAGDDLTPGELEGEIIIDAGGAGQLTLLSTFHIPIRGPLT